MNKGNLQIGKVAHLGGKAILEKYGKDYFKKLSKKAQKRRKELSVSGRGQ